MAAVCVAYDLARVTARVNTATGDERAIHHAADSLCAAMAAESLEQERGL